MSSEKRPLGTHTKWKSAKLWAVRTKGYPTPNGTPSRSKLSTILVSFVPQGHQLEIKKLTTHFCCQREPFYSWRSHVTMLHRKHWNKQLPVWLPRFSSTSGGFVTWFHHVMYTWSGNSKLNLSKVTACKLTILTS